MHSGWDHVSSALGDKGGSQPPFFYVRKLPL